MPSFKDLKDNKDFITLDAKRTAVLLELKKLKVNLEKLPREKPSIRSYERCNSNIDTELDRLKTASAAVSDYFASIGVDSLDDEEFLNYMNIETTLTGEMEIIRDSYFELLKSHGHFPPTPAPAAPPEEMVTKADLIDALKGLAQSHISVAEKQASAAETQAKALAKSFKSPILAVPVFNPVECRNDPLAWTSFWAKFDHFSKNCPDDESKLGFLLQAVTGDALKLIKDLTCTDENFKVAKKLLEEEYNKPNAVKFMLLLKCLRFKIKNSNDFSEFHSAILNLRVQINELNKNHAIDVKANAAAELVRVIIHDALPGNILSMYQSLTSSEYPSLDDFLTKSRTVADRLISKQKNQNKNTTGSKSGSSANSKPTPSAEIPLTTIPTNISSVAKTVPPKGNKPRRMKSCLFCLSDAHISSRCTVHPTIETRMQVMKDNGKVPCKKCIIAHGPNKTCLPCGFRSCRDAKTTEIHGALACPLVLSQLKTQTPTSDTKVVKVTTQKKVCSVALPTFTAQLHSSVTDKS